MRVKSFTPSVGEQYYLVVPVNGVREGSYGTGALGEIPPGLFECLTQAIAACP